MKLYELTTGYQQILEMIEDGNDDYIDTLESLEDAIEIKVENTAKVIRSIKAQAIAIREEEKRLANRRRSLENQSRRLKDYLHNSLKAVGKRSIKGTLLTVAIQKNPPSLKVTDVDAIDKSYFTTPKPTLDRRALLQAIKDGAEVTGAKIQQGESLRIR